MGRVSFIRVVGWCTLGLSSSGFEESSSPLLCALFLFFPVYRRAAAQYSCRFNVALLYGARTNLPISLRVGWDGMGWNSLCRHLSVTTSLVYSSLLSSLHSSD